MTEIENGSGGGEDIIQEISPNGRFIRYEEVVGRGLIKVAYKGFDQEHGNDVVWYQIHADGDNNNNNNNAARDVLREKDSLFSEGELLKTLKHDNIIKCHSLWIDDANKNVNLITELLNAGNLKQYRNKHKSVDLKAMKNWGKQILRGLHYLHTHDPPIVHRDLKCDNIFVNGNHGKVKIGNFGMSAHVSSEGKVKGVLGTPEFMAPEIYNGEYNELVDIYAFGMCMLEIVTCEYPYSECINQAHIYKKVTTCVKPLALGRVKDPHIKILIEKCLAPSSKRLTAIELLQDPIFSTGISPNPSIVISADSTLESSREAVDMRFTLQGKRVDEKTILFNLRTLGMKSYIVNNFEFNFDIVADDAVTVALELVQGNDLMIKDIPHVVDLMDSMLLKLQPGWKPSVIDQFGCKEVRFEVSFLEAVTARVD